MVEKKPGEAYSSFIKKLEEAGIENPAHEIKVLLQELFGIEAGPLPPIKDLQLSHEQLVLLDRQVKARAGGVPLQYIIGNWDFYGRRFAVGDGVLIPRPETEILVETVLHWLADKKAPTVVDLCAGSGCIGITIGCEREDAAVFLVEKSREAAEFCETNRKNLLPRAVLFVADALTFDQTLPPLTAVVSNPPYIARHVLPTLQTEVRHEPAMALDGGEDGLFFYKKLTPIWKERLAPGGLLAYEIGYDQGLAVREILNQNGFVNIRQIKDYEGHDRVITGEKA